MPPAGSLKDFVSAQRRFFGSADQVHFQFQTQTPYFAQTEAALLQPLVPHLGPHTRLLEIGCGEGANLFHLGQGRPQVHLLGVDASPAKAAFAQAHLRAAGLRTDICAADAARLPFPDHSFDAALIRDLLHHVPDRVAILREAARVLRPGRPLLLIEPNGRSPLVLLQMALTSAERGAWRSTGPRLRDELLAAGFEVEAQEALQPLPLGRVLLHPQLGWPRLAGAPGCAAALGATEALLGQILPRGLWMYLRFCARTGGL